MRTIEIKRIGHKLEALDLNEKVLYTIDLSEHLDGDTVLSHTFEISDSDGEDVVADFGKNSSVDDDSICSIGITAYAVGTYTIILWFTCNEYLPDNITRRTFKVELILTVK